MPSPNLGHAIPMRIDQASFGHLLPEVTSSTAADRASLMPGDLLIDTAERRSAGQSTRWRAVAVQLRQIQKETA